MRNLISMFFFPLLFLFICHQTFFFSQASAHLIQDTCKKSAQGDPHINYDFCVSSFQKDPRSSTADLQGLGVISVELAIANATSTLSYIKELFKNASDPFIKERLSSCSDEYSDAVPTLQDAGVDMKSKRYDDANIKVSAGMAYADSCEEGFKEEDGHASPLTKENNDLDELGAIALSLTVLLK
ncbi:putative invertase inhibitor [Tasmannia lanceolata]|uniref:putative invertase inhibitor n=1 Tax=Tasmannia lanceolata TaxID=3420 RepID=UPI004064BB66